jgi:hypothetical protein
VTNPSSPPLPTLSTRARHKLREWVLRYGIPEIIGTITAVGSSWIAYHLTTSLAISAVAGTIGENIGYYGYSGAREILEQYERHRHHPPLKRYALTAWRTVRDLLIEFGPAEIVDSFVVRPFCMYIFPLLTHHFVLGILAGKLVADVIFYSIAIVSYELKKKHLYKQD